MWQNMEVIRQLESVLPNKSAMCTSTVSNYTKWDMWTEFWDGVLDCKTNYVWQISPEESKVFLPLWYI